MRLVGFAHAFVATGMSEPNQQQWRLQVMTSSFRWMQPAAALLPTSGIANASERVGGR
jgi:hypothetical protein